jgi:hypothetical protein
MTPWKSQSPDNIALVHVAMNSNALSRKVFQVARRGDDENAGMTNKQHLFDTVALMLRRHEARSLR